ncbi:DUF5017 domain-containing protein [Flavobacterium sp. Sd200]|uniref:choice-of-anchor J domain-containing protein n=1 Tax=Flavobacterium sp. Sd200 TaxID=2692211 RepID=UPI001367FD24|nr:choice-of-anchor J domain-containing protein [Flavobacterium sp. Sd200]MXN92552.1 DUF5017 domain-containing protein [Flavobacterium sp. Sd200]
MKNNFKLLLVTALTSVLFTGCVGDDDTVLPHYDALPLSQTFNTTPDFTPILDNTILDIDGWQNIAQTGSALWRVQVYQSNGYAELSCYQTGDPVNVSWLVSPEFIPTEKHKTLSFEVAQSYVTNVANKLEVFVSEDFNGTDVATATWVPLTVNIPGTSAVYFEFMDSGNVDLTQYVDKQLHLAFKVTGSGTNTNLDGSYQIDNVNVK